MPLLRFNAIENGTLVMNGKTFVVKNHQLEVSDTDAEYLLKMPGFSLIEEKPPAPPADTTPTPAPVLPSVQPMSENTPDQAKGDPAYTPSLSQPDTLDRVIVSLKRRIHRVPKIVRDEDADTTIKP